MLELRWDMRNFKQGFKNDIKETDEYMHCQ